MAGLGLSACGGGAAAPAILPPAISVSISASTTALGSNQTSTLTATVSNDGKNAGVTWSIPAGSPGTLATVDSLHATYTSGTVTQSASVTVTATSISDPTKTSSVTLQLASILTVAVSPATSDLGAGQTTNLQASIANDPKSAGVTWSLSAGAAGTLATVDTTHATYTAPASVASASSVTVTATSITDSTKTGTATINLHPVSVSIGTPAAAAVAPLQTSLVSATAFDPKGVTWTASAGTILGLDAGCAQGTSCCPNNTCSAIYAAPADIAASGSATLTVTSVTDATKTSSTTINLNAASYWEDLTAYNNGLNLSVVKPYKDLERGGAGSGVFQPDRIIFHEIAAGANGQPINTEIWRLDNDSPVANPGKNDNAPTWFIPGVLNRTPWNENGTAFLLSSNACVPEDFCPANEPAGEGGDLHLYQYDAAGDLVRLVIPNDPARGVNQRQLGLSNGYTPWDQNNPNLFYLVTANDTQASASEGLSGLYSVDISNGYAMNEVAKLPEQTDAVTNQPINKILQSYLSNDDKVLVQDVNAPPITPPTNPDYIPNIYMVDVNKASATFGTIVDQFPINFSGLSAPCITGLNCTNNNFLTTDQYHIHDIYFQRDAANHFIFNYGTKGDVGEFVFWQASMDGKSVQLAYPNLLTIPPAVGTPYLSHPAMNFDGSLVSYAGYDNMTDLLAGNSQGSGTWIRNVDPTNGYNFATTVNSLGAESVNHQGWDGYDPNYVIFDGYLDGLPAGYISQGYPTAASFTSTSCDKANVPSCIAPYGQMSDSPHDANGSTVHVLVNDGLRDSGAVGDNQAPPMTNGPAQSPDATKIMFTTPQSFSNLNSGYNAYIAVDHRPLPPALASATGSPVTLTWTPYLTAREIAGYHVYYSTDGKTWTEDVCAAENTAAFDSVPGTTFTDCNNVTGASTDWAVTAQEYSGLESSVLSNVLTSAGAAGAAQGTTGFDTSAPAPPSGLTLTNLGTGEWKLTWTASPSSDVRYYDIFYSGAGVPNIASPLQAQHYLIDSPAASETSYIYWQANPKDVPVFGIIAVDRQDNFSSLVCVYSNNTTASCP